MATTRVIITKKNDDGKAEFMEVEPVDAREHEKHGWTRLSAEKAAAYRAELEAAEAESSADDGEPKKETKKKKPAGGGNDAPPPTLPGDASIGGTSTDAA